MGGENPAHTAAMKKMIKAYRLSLKWYSGTVNKLNKTAK